MPNPMPRSYLDAYQGTPFQAPQVIPGRLLLAHFDQGGEGVAHHNYSTKNEGSGALNQGPEPKNHFREHDGISTSYTKAAFDKFADGRLLPLDQFYVGWTFPGQWLNYTVDVQTPGRYVMKALVSSNGNHAAVSFDVDGADQTGPLAIPTTGNYHTWQQLENLAEITLTAGKHVITVRVHKEGGMNLGHIDFVLKA